MTLLDREGEAREQMRGAAPEMYAALRALRPAIIAARANVTAYRHSGQRREFQSDLDMIDAALEKAGCPRG